MQDRRRWWRIVITTAAVVALIPAMGLAFPQSTDTSGELPADLSGVWLVVHHLEFARPSPAPSPAAAASGDTSATKPAEAAANQPPLRVVNALNLYKIHHLKKDEAQKLRDAAAKMQQASVDKANAILAQDRKKHPPKKTASGETDAPKVIVPTVPRRPGDPTDLYDESEIVLLDVALPASIDESLQKANKAETAWEPTDQDLALLKSSWSTLAPSGRDEYSHIEWKVYAPEYFEEGLNQDEHVRGSKLAITANEAMIPKPGQADKNIVIYGVRELSDTRLSGDHVRAIMTSAPFPIPIEMKGHFEMFKLTDLPGDTTAKPPAAAKPAAKKGAK